MKMFNKKSEAYSKPYETSKMELFCHKMLRAEGSSMDAPWKFPHGTPFSNGAFFAKTVKCRKPLILFAKSSILDVS